MDKEQLYFDDQRILYKKIYDSKEIEKDSEEEQEMESSSNESEEENLGRDIFGQDPSTHK